MADYWDMWSSTKSIPIIGITENESTQVAQMSICWCWVVWKQHTLTDSAWQGSHAQELDRLHLSITPQQVNWTNRGDVTSESSKLNSYHKPQSIGFIACLNTSPIFFAVSLQRSEHADVICWFYNNIACFKLAFSKPHLRASKRKADCVIMTSFSWSILKRFKRRATAMLNSVNKLEIH